MVEVVTLGLIDVNIADVERTSMPSTLFTDNGDLPMHRMNQVRHCSACYSAMYFVHVTIILYLLTRHDVHPNNFLPTLEGNRLEKL